MLTPRIQTGLIASAALAAMLCVPLAFAFDIPPNDGFVTDAAGILASGEKQQLDQRLQQYKDSTTNEIAIVTVTSLRGEPIEDIALQIGRKWGVGSSKDNGILILVSHEDREVRIEVGYGLEGAVPDIVAKGVIDTDIVPHFRDGDYAGGITAALDSLQKHIGGEYTADRYEQSADSFVGPWIFLVFFILLQWMIAILGRTKSWWLGGVIGGIGGFLLSLLFGWWLAIPVLIPLGLLLDFVVSQNYKKRGPTSWWAGGGWGPGGGGMSGGSGFGGFGGGSFGGGGASGRW